jgi:hypothetical protein
MKSPLGSRASLEGYSWELDDLWRKMVVYNSDHAADVRLAANKCIDRKRAVAESDLGWKEIDDMDDAEVEAALWDVVQEIYDDQDGLQPGYFR